MHMRMYLHSSIIDKHKSIMDIYNSIMDISNSVIDDYLRQIWISIIA